MERPLAVLLAVHLAIVVYSVIGCITSSQNYGQDYPALFSATPVKPVQDPDSMTNQTNTSSGNSQVYENSTNYLDELSAMANYRNDARTSVMLPFLCTAVAAAGIVVAGVLDHGVFDTTTILYADFAMWLINFSFMVSFLQVQQRNYLSDSVRTTFQACLPAVVVLFVFMLLLLAAAIGACGWSLRRKKIAWLRINCLQIFTIRTLFIVVRVVTTSITLPDTMIFVGRGVKPRDEHDDLYCDTGHGCAHMRLDATTYFCAIAMLCLSSVIATEAFLSHWFGAAHRTLSIIFALVSGLGNLIIWTVMSPVGLAYMDARVYMFTTFNGITGLELFYSWLLYFCSDFINSPPNLLKLLCGRNKKPEEEEEEDVGMNPGLETGNAGVDEGDNISPTVGGTSTEAERNIQAPTDDKTKMENVSCFVVNIFLAILGLISLGMLGYAVENQMTSLLSETVLLVALTSTVAKAAVTIITVIGTGRPPLKIGLQLTLEMVLENLLLLVGVVTMLASSVEAPLLVACLLALLIIVIKIVGLLRASAVHKGLRLLARSNTATSAVAIVVPSSAAETVSLTSSVDASPSDALSVTAPEVGQAGTSALATSA